MKAKIIKAFKSLIFNNTNLKTYAIADSVREPELQTKLLLSGLNAVDLWHSAISDDVFDVPLYLIELDEGNNFVDWLIEKQDKKVATYFQSFYGLEELQQYYSEFTYPQIGLNNGDYQKGIFGFYDPLVLPNYIKTLYSQEKAEEFFTAAFVWYSPKIDDDNKIYITYRNKENKIEEEILNLKTGTELNNDLINIPDEGLLAAGDIIIDHKQIEIFKIEEKKKFCIKVLGLLDEKDIDKHLPTAMEAFDYSEKLGIDSEANQLRIIQIAINLPKPITQGYDNHFTLVKKAKTEFEKTEKLDVILVMLQQQEKIKNEA